MSDLRRHDVEKAAARAGVPGIARSTLSAMTRLSTGEGGALREAFASYARLALETGYSERSVRRAVKWLRDHGWLADTGKTHGRTNRIRVYRYAVPNAARVAGSNAAREAGRRNKEEKERDLNVDSVDQDKRESAEMASQKGLFGGEDASADLAAQWEDAMALWHQLAQEAGRRVGRIPKAGPIGRSLNARLREHGYQDVARVMRWFWRSPRAEWWREHTTFTTLVRPSQFPRLLDKAIADPAADAEYKAPAPPVKTRPVLATRKRPPAATRKGVSRDE